MRLIPVRITLQQRVVWALTLLVVLFVALQGGLAYLSMAEQEDDLVDDLVQTEALRLKALIEERGAEAARQQLQSPALGQNLNVWLVPASPGVPPTELPPYLLQLGDGPHRLKQASAELHVYILATPAGRLYLQYDAAVHEEKVNEFGIFLLGLTLLCSALAILAARQLAAIVVAPMERLTRQLTAWAPATRMEDGEERDEEARLRAAFQRVQARFEEGLAQEREFMANARHEIRTPLTALRTDLEMLALQADAAAGPRLQRALDGVDEIAAALDLAQSLAQKRALTTERIDLADCVDHAWSSLAGTPHILRLRFDNRVARTVSVSADRHALLTILRNLIRNAAEHAAASHCSVSYGARGIEVMDDGIGIPATEQPLLFERHYRGQRLDVAAKPTDASAAFMPAPAALAAGEDESKPERERGIGLAIARQLAELHGWQLSVESTVGGGSCFILQMEHG
ncbi:putative HAMP domain-containing protein 16 [Sterolibacterium denitrificans]|uniref:histidine kinase n=1 Tax=Sterolibacterium denitrificans TaxID=157592 RepID=A0A7Z7HPL2_9PROT|nr:ATP-binding protein [Sterolibacterium denitrificans]SMB22647.1 putative HAMP domain-containing protein 16 [Sterolibacterium denitrificans]